MDTRKNIRGVVCSSITIDRYKGAHYPHGFHIFTKLHDALDYTGNVRGIKATFKVKFKQVVRKGYQWETPVIVAKQIYVMEAIK